MNQRNFYDYLGKVAIVVTPLAAAIAFGWSVYESTLATTAVYWLSIIAGMATAVALESVGMLAGHTASDFYQQKDRRWIVAAAVMVIYVGAGLYELQGTSVAVVFLISPLVYVLVAMKHTANEHKSDKATAVADGKAWKRQQSVVAAGRRHELKMAELTLSFQGNNQETSQETAVHSEQSANSQETKKETMRRIWKPGMTVSELSRLAKVSKSYASKYMSSSKRGI